MSGVASRSSLTPRSRRTSTLGGARTTGDTGVIYGQSDRRTGGRGDGRRGDGGVACPGAGGARAWEGKATLTPPEAMVEYALLNAGTALKTLGANAYRFMTDLDWRIILALACVVVLLAWYTRPKTRM